MRLMIKKYQDGGEYCYETTNDGSELLREIKDDRGSTDWTSAFVEVLCDETGKGADRALDALSWLRQEVVKRKAAWHSDNNRTQPSSRRQAVS
ncbi:MAG TPA: hypothetical protein VJ783_01840 [Pirellulales bacterium]|nr:hypothetical protein [Pirellulales bacterium]